MNYYIISGEASGDLHGSNLIKELHKIDGQASIRCWGGELMQAAGATLVKHYRDLAFMGFAEVVKNLPTIFKNISFCKKDILAHRPDVLVLIDYPGFNLRIAKWARQQGLKIVYYISPQIWAWKESRIHSIKKNVDKMLVILPFEKDFYAKWNFEAEYVGHPLVEVVAAFKASKDRSYLSKAAPDVDVQSISLDVPNDTEQKSPPKIIALLPGSRQQEILKKLPIMLGVATHFPDYKFVVAKAPGLPEDFYADLLAPYSNVGSVANATYDLLSQSAAALVTSGTATLETALFNVPEVICYKGNSISYHIARRLIKIKYICLVNLIMDKEVVKELIQDELTIPNLAAELEQLLKNKEKQTSLQKDYDDLKNLLSAGGHASSNAAKSIYAMMS
ncbi:MAG: lipid-A-disaccharide synthase [Gloeobacteraceae cyanobacterium ES-bin-316]|nr:lipid-A-disaccharide synthase [Ferruginibacter sp.]